MIHFITHVTRVSAGPLIAALCLLISGCTTLPELTAQPPRDWADTQARRQAIDHWNISARLGVRSEQHNGSLDLFWTQREQDYTVRLLAPFGQGTILIRGNADGVMVRSREGTYYNDDADALFTEQLGVALPLEGLRAWLRGIPMADTPVRAARWSLRGQLIKMQQLGWRIEMTDYQKVGQYALPHAFYLQRIDRAGPGIKLVIHAWQLEPV